MLTLKELLVGVLAPFLIGAIVTAAGAKRAPRACAGLALAAAYIAAQTALFGVPSFAPAPVEHALVWVTLAALAVGLIEARWRWPVWAAQALRAAAVGGSCWLILRLKAVNGQWTPLEVAAWTAGLTVASLALWALVSTLTQRLEREPGRAWHAALPLSAAIGIGALLIILDGHSLTVGQFAGALSVALLGVGAASALRRTPALNPAGVAVVSLVPALLWIHAWLWTDLTPWYAPIIAASPAVALAALTVPALRRARPWLRALVATAAATLPLLPLLGWELKQAIDEQRASSELGY